MKLTDESPLPVQFKAHANKPLIQVPADYLLWAYDQPWVKAKYPELCVYIDENRAALDAEQGENEQARYMDKTFGRKGD